MKLLFVTWDGPQVNYLESLFVPIFRGLKAQGITTEVLQFRWGSDASQAAARRACSEAGVGYRAVTVSRAIGPIGAFASALAGAKHILRAARETGADVIMPRSHMPALAVLAAGVGRLPPICFDADGLPAEERVEFGTLKRGGATYRALKAIETAMIRRSRSVLVRSPFAADYLSKQSGAPSSRFHVVTNGRDETLFAPGTAGHRAATRHELDIAPKAPLLVYAGSAGAQYRFDRMAEVALAVRTRLPDARLLVLTASPNEARALLGPEVLAMTDIRSAPPGDVPALLAAADLGFSFRERSTSMRAVSPIKTAEYLLCGVPTLGTAGIGDTEAAEESGVFVDEAVGAEGAAGWLADQILPERNRFRQDARRVGNDRFSLARSVNDYLLGLAGL